MTIARCDYAALSEHVDDSRHEEPPILFLVGIVEETVFEPCLLVLVKCRNVSLRLSVLASDVPDAECEESKNGSE